MDQSPNQESHGTEESTLNEVRMITHHHASSNLENLDKLAAGYV
jgi:hypothetical protein